MLPNGRRLGAHLPLGNGMVRAADRAAAIGASAIQVFCDNPTSWRRRPTLPEELPAFRERLAANDIAPIAIHAPYLVNLAGPEEAFWERSIEVLANELRVGREYGARFVNVHIGSHRGEGVAYGIARVTEGIARVLAEAPDTDGVRLVLENGSGGGFGLGSTVEEMAAIEEAVAARGIDGGRVGWCLDTAHLWGAGYPIDTPAGVDEVIAAFDGAIGLDRLAMIHFNDSRSERGSRSDRHEHVGAGRIGPAGLARLLAHPDLGHVVYYLETPGMDEGYDLVNLERARALSAGEPLDALPKEAFTLPPRRGRAAPPDPDGDDPSARAAARAARPRRTPKPTPPRAAGTV